MRSNTFSATLIKTALAASALLLGSGAAHAQQQINLSAGPVTATLPDGQAVPMWGYSCGAAVATNTAPVATCAPLNPAAAANPLVWSPVVITVPAGQVLQINLTNLLTFTTTGATNNVPTSIVIDGQLGGGLGTDRTTAPSPAHPAQGTTWFGTGGSTTTGSAVFTPPTQVDRVRSLATEVAAGNVTPLTWTNLRPGTYLFHSGTQPSLQHPMGLHGVLVVTEPDTTATPPLHQAYGANFDIDIPLVLSELDPVQNRAVDAAVRTAGFSDANVWNGSAGQCGDPAAPVGVVNTCYPPAVNYSPLYYLVNGVAFDRTNAAAPAPAVPATATTGNVLLRFVNAGLRMHVPSVVGASLTLVAEDGSKLPGTPRTQSEVFLAAGKTYDVTIQPKQLVTTPPTTPAAYIPATYAVFDRALSLSTSNQRDGGMQVYINVNGGAPPPAITLSASDKTYYCMAATPLAIADPSKGLLGGSTGANGVALPATPVFTGDLSATTLALQSDGTFTYTPTAGTTCGGSFQYLVNGTASHTATISQCDANSASAPGCTLAAPPQVANVQFNSNVATLYKATPPGLLTGVTSNPGGFALTAVATATGLTLSPDGSFIATNAGATTCPAGLNPVPPAGATCLSFGYQAKNAQGTLSNSAIATVVFLPASNLVVNVVDIKTRVAITDYRWIIEEDRTFQSDPNCQVNTGTGARPLDSFGRPCPPLPVESLGYSFHTASMPVVAQGCFCTGPAGSQCISCEAGQTVQGQAATCDIGNGACRATSDPSTLGVVVDPTAGQKAQVSPGSVYLDPTKHYFISVLPGDAINSTINAAGGPQQVDPTCNPTTATCSMRQFDIATDCGPYTGPTGAWEPGGLTALCGHAMGGAPIAPVFAGQTAHSPVTISLQETPLPTAKISAFVFQDDNPLNGENDAGGGVDVLAPNEAGLGGFELKLWDQGGGLGDATGQITYDMFNQPVSNSLAGSIDPLTGLDACPITPNGSRLVGMIPTCPKFESDGATLSPLAGQAVIANLYPGLYEIQA
jgi:FtsP/CotA-like multicopper oxidase with cupredoxin domain